MEALTTKIVHTGSGSKDISVYLTDIGKMDTPVDLLVLSAFKYSYAPIPGTVIQAIDQAYGINVEQLSMSPAIDLRDCGGGVWISKEFKSNAPFKRIACVEIRSWHNEGSDQQVERNVFKAVKTLFHALMIASINQIPMESVAIPALGGNNQQISLDIVMPPLLNECIGFLKQCDDARHILFYERSPAKAFQMAQSLENSYQLFADEKKDSPAQFCSVPEAGKSESKTGPRAFLSYSSKDLGIMMQVNTLLEEQGLRTWYAPRDITLSSYAESIVKGIKDSDYFVVLLSTDSMRSRHVLNELDLAFAEKGDDSRLIPIRLDSTEINDSFRYYLSRLEWYQLKIHPNGTNLPAFEDIIPKIEGNT